MSLLGHVALTISAEHPEWRGATRSAYRRAGFAASSLHNVVFRHGTHVCSSLLVVLGANTVETCPQTDMHLALGSFLLENLFYGIINTEEAPHMLRKQESAVEAPFLRIKSSGFYPQAPR